MVVGALLPPSPQPQPQPQPEPQETGVQEPSGAGETSGGNTNGGQAGGNQTGGHGGAPSSSTSASGGGSSNRAGGAARAESPAGRAGRGQAVDAAPRPGPVSQESLARAKAQASVDDARAAALLASVSAAPDGGVGYLGALVGEPSAASASAAAGFVESQSAISAAAPAEAEATSVNY